MAVAPGHFVVVTTLYRSPDAGRLIVAHLTIIRCPAISRERAVRTRRILDEAPGGPLTGRWCVP